jgi:NAD(P) transhydrogenase subunit alpha
MSLIMTFVLALFIGFMVIWSVSPALHTPLMSVTNAISGIIVVGAMLCLEPDEGNIDFGSVLGILSVLFASINIWGGFIVTYRMLQMFKTNLADEAAKH